MSERVDYELVAKALKAFAESIDLGVLGERWAESDGTGVWSAENAASEIQFKAYQWASALEGDTIPLGDTFEGFDKFVREVLYR